MKALILAAGVGKRLSPYTDYSPKCLLDMGGMTLAQRMLKALKKAGVNHVYFVIGYLKEKIQQTFGNSFEGMKVEYLINDRYLEGSILSLWTAREVLKEDDFLIMDADVLFPPQLIQRLARSKHSNCLLLDDRFTDTDEEMKLGARGERVLTIARRLEEPYDKIGEGVGFLKVGRKSLDSLRNKLDEFYHQARVSCEYEELLNEWFKIEEVGYEYVGDLPWTEIDFQTDLKKAFKFVLPKIEALENVKKIVSVNRRLSDSLTKIFLKTSITPNQITALSFISGLLALFFFSRGAYIPGIVGALFFQLSHILDNCDGEVARAKHLSSLWGSWFDIAVDGIIHILLFPSIAWGLFREGASQNIFVLSCAASAGILITFVIFMTKRILRQGKDNSLIYIAPYPIKKRRKILEYLKAGDFSLLVLMVALGYFFTPFIWLSAFGANIFWVLVLLLNLEETSVE